MLTLDDGWQCKHKKKKKDEIKERKMIKLMKNDV